MCRRDAAILLRSRARVLSTLSALAHGARPERFDSVTLGSFPRGDAEDAHSLQVPSLVPRIANPRIVVDSPVSTTTGAISVCSVTNGTGGSFPYPCNCGSEQCRGGQWCNSASNQCLGATASALSVALDESGVEAVPLVNDALNDSKRPDKDWEVRVEVVEVALPKAIRKLSADDALPLLNKALDDRRLGVRKAAVREALPVAVDVCGARAERLIDKAANDTHDEVRELLVSKVLPKAIGKLGASIDMLPLLTKVFNDTRVPSKKYGNLALDSLRGAIEKYGIRAQPLIENAIHDVLSLKNSGPCQGLVHRVLPTAIDKLGVGMIPVIRRGLQVNKHSAKCCRVVAGTLLAEIVEKLGNASLELLEMALTSNDRKVRKLAAGRPLLVVTKNRTLATVFDVRKWVENMSNDRDENVQMAAAASLSVLAKKDVELAAGKLAAAQDRESQAESKATQAEKAQKEAAAEMQTAEQQKKVAVEKLAVAESKNLVFDNLTRSLRESEERLARQKEEFEAQKLNIMVKEGVDSQMRDLKDKLFDFAVALGAAALPLIATMAYWGWKSMSSTSADDCRDPTPPRGEARAGGTITSNPGNDPVSS